jgi:4-hydroxybenzoate polyprenyltransferase
LCPDDWISGRYAEALHPSRWFKNLLIFLPLFDAANRIDMRFVVSIYLAFCAYCLVASSGYIANDLADLNADRRHALKHRRPFASGRLAVAKGLALSLGLAALGLGLGFFLSPFLAGWLCLYLALSLAYSMWIKKTLVLDVFALTALSMHRVLTGTIMMGAAPSFWLVLFSGFLFFGLAVLGRYGELKSTRLWARRRATRALAYRSGDLDVLASFGLASGYLSVAILALFVLTADAHASFRTPEMLWLICPLLLYWIGRVWIFARRGKVPEDPLQFAIRDKPSIYVVAAALALLSVAVFLAVPLPAL